MARKKIELVTPRHSRMSKGIFILRCIRAGLFRPRLLLRFVLRRIPIAGRRLFSIEKEMRRAGKAFDKKHTDLNSGAACLRRLQ